MNKDSKIYISGHNGMVGKTMLDLLKKEGYTNIITRDSKKLDLKDQKAVEEFFKSKKPEYVFHFAAKVGGIMANIENPATFLYDNLMISSNVIHSSHKFKVKKLINLGSSCIYPRECEQPMKEEYLLTGKLEPTNEGYALAKIIGLKLCETYNIQHKTDFISLMPCNLYGINERFDINHSHVLAALIMKFHKAKTENLPSVTLWGTGKAKREFLYVEDLSKAILHFATNYSSEDLNNEFINIGSGEDISIKDLAELIKKIVGYEGEVEWDSSKPDGMPRKLLDISKMKEYEFTPETSLEKGIKKTYKYYLENA